jgi:hypothetical protein
MNASKKKVVYPLKKNEAPTRFSDSQSIKDFLKVRNSNQFEPTPLSKLVQSKNVAENHDEDLNKVNTSLSLSH